MSKSAHCLSALAAVFILAAVAPTYAQTTFGSIVGTVTDPTGAGVAGTPVNLTNLGTGAKQTQNTNTQGLYQFVNLTPGNYSVEVSKTGFKRFLRSPVTVQTETTTPINVSLQVGEVTQTVEVTSQTPLLAAGGLVTGTSGRSAHDEHATAKRAQSIELDGAGSLSRAPGRSDGKRKRPKSVRVWQLSNWRRHGEPKHGVAGRFACKRKLYQYHGAYSDPRFSPGIQSWN